MIGKNHVNGARVDFNNATRVAVSFEVNGVLHRNYHDFADGVSPADMAEGFRTLAAWIDQVIAEGK